MISNIRNSIYIYIVVLLLFSSCGFSFISLGRNFKHKYYSIEDSLRIFKINKPHPILKKYKKWYSKFNERDFDLLGLYVLKDTINLKDTVIIYKLCREVLKVQYPKLLNKNGYQLSESRILYDTQHNQFIKIFLESSGYSFQLHKYSNILIFQQRMWICFDCDGF
jgi:hypothetical protein